MRKTVSAKAVLKALEAGEKIPEGAKEEAIEVAKSVIEAKKFVKDFIEKNGTRAMLAERLRDHYIGEAVKTGNSVNIQAVRGKPYGTIVALPTKDGNVVCGMSYIATSDKASPFPVLGQYIALKRAIDGLEAGKVRAEAAFVKPKAAMQIKHFESRALRFFYPEKYSYSRGNEPINTYDAELQKRRLMILGDEKYNASMLKKRTKEELDKVRAGDSNFKPGN